MNWILGFFFIAFIVVYYNILGKVVLKYIGFKDLSFSKRLITGFISLKFIQWVIGFPCQFFHVSWNVYFWIMLIVNMSVFVILFLKNKDCMTFDVVHMKMLLLNHTRMYWFIYVITIVFALWSMASQLPYFLMNYDDHYYLGAIIQQTGSAALSTENFFSGAPMDVGLTRLINTFEIDYAFWANLFHIYPVFFARAVMVIHNYLIVFLAFHAFIVSIKKTVSVYTQFIIFPFLILIIPAGYLESMNIVRVYDGWQMNTAIWYGGSIVRLAGLPILIMYAYEITKKITIKSVLFVMAVCGCLVSLSSIALPYILIGCVIGWMLLAYQIFKQNTRNCKFISLGMIVFMLMAIKIGPKVLEVIDPTQVEKMVYAVTSYRNMMGYYINENYIYMIASTIIIFQMFKKENRDFTIVGVCVLFCIFICYSNLFDKFLIIISMKYDFVALRLITGFQMLLLLYIGYYFSRAFCYVCKYSLIHSITYVLLVFAINILNYQQIETYKSEEYNRIATGTSIFGYSFSRLVQSTTMAPQIYYDLYHYFSNEENNFNRIINPKIISYEEGNLFLAAGMSFSANNIQLCITDASERCDDMNNGEITKLSDYTLNRYNYDEISDLLLKYNISYVLTPSDEVRDNLVVNGHTLVMESHSLYNDILYLIKL